MTIVSCALALLSGVIGAGFASGREIAYFFAAYGPAAPVSGACACLALYTLFCRLPAQMERAGVSTLAALCAMRFGPRFGRLCAGLFFLLFAITGGAMLAACAEIAALTLPIHHAYGLGLLFSLALGALLAARGMRGMALPGAALTLLLPILLVRLLALPVGEACFAPARGALPAALSGFAYGALNAAMLTGALPLLLILKRPQRKRAVLLFLLLFALLLALGVSALMQHRQAAFFMNLPFVALSRPLGKPGYYLCAACLYAAALSTLCAMLAGLWHMLPTLLGKWVGLLASLLFACMGFGTLITRGYPVLGALCAALLGLLCLPLPQKASSSVR